MEKIIIPQQAVEKIQDFADKIRKSFKKKKIGPKPKYIGFFTLSDEKHPDRYVGVLVQDEFEFKGEAKKTVASYNHVADAIFVYREVLNEKYGALGVEHFLAHELAHAVDRDRLQKDGAPQPKYVHIKANAQRFIDEYACQPAEFAAEMAAIEYVEIPFIKKNYMTLVATYLNTTTGYIGCWSRNKKLSKAFREQLEKMIDLKPEFRELENQMLDTAK